MDNCINLCHHFQIYSKWLSKSIASDCPEWNMGTVLKSKSLASYLFSCRICLILYQFKTLQFCTWLSSGWNPPFSMLLYHKQVSSRYMIQDHSCTSQIMTHELHECCFVYAFWYTGHFSLSSSCSSLGNFYLLVSYFSFWYFFHHSCLGLMSGQRMFYLVSPMCPIMISDWFYDWKDLAAGVFKN